MPTYNITTASLVSNVATLTLTSVSGLKTGMLGTVSGLGHPYDGDNHLITVDSTLLEVTYSQNHVNIAEATVDGELYVPVTWVTGDDVYGFLGLLPSEALDEAWLDLSVSAGNDWCYERRQEAGYSDLIEAVPSQRVKLGTVMKCAEMYRMRGSFGSYQQYGDLEVNSPINSNVEIMRMLGINRPAIA
jgi:hypothetical protein